MFIWVGIQCARTDIDGIDRRQPLDVESVSANCGQMYCT